MSDNDTELLERAQSIVRKALSAISEDKEAERQEEEPESGDETDHVTDHLDVNIYIGLEDIKLENENNPEARLQQKAIKEAAVTLTEQVLSKAMASEDDVNASTSSPEPDNLVPGDNLLPDQETGDYISLLSRGSTHSLRIPSADLLDDQEEDKDEVMTEETEETRDEFVIRKTFENFTEYAKLLNDKDKLSEKRYLQLLRELGLVGPGAKINTTDAEMLYYKHAAQRTVGLTISEFNDCLRDIVKRNEREMESITEEVLYPAVPVHHYRTVFMSVK